MQFDLFAQRKIIPTQWLIILILVLAAVGVYFNAFPNQFVHDDIPQIVENPWIKNVRFLPEIITSAVWDYRGEAYASNYYRPLMHIIYTMAYHIFGLRPWGFRLINILFHAGTTILVFLLALRLFNKDGKPSSGKDHSRLPAFLAALLFAVHPIHTEAVTWIAGLPDVSFTFFYLLAFYLYIQLDRSKTQNIFPRSNILCLLFFFLALLCKETALTFFPLILVYDYLFERSQNNRISLCNLIKWYLPYITVICGYLLLRTYALGRLTPSVQIHFDLSLYQQIINIFPLFVQYLVKLIFPVNLNSFHVLHPISSLWGWAGVSAFIITIAFLMLIIITGKTGKVLCFSLLWILIPLLPVLYVPVLGVNPFAERYLYLSSAGFVLIVVILFKKLLWRFSLHPRSVLWLSGVLVVLLAGSYAIGTVQRNPVWKDNLSLWSDVVQKAPDAPTAYNNLGTVFGSKGQIDRAIVSFQKQIELNPAYPQAHFNLGKIYADRGQENEAAYHFRKALERSPNYAEVHNSWGVVLARAGKLDSAIIRFKQAIAYRPLYPKAHDNLGTAFAAKGDFPRAVKHFRQALYLEPGNKLVRQKLGQCQAILVRRRKTKSAP
ncbi:tetratricopeptide repeat protein [Candidatus Margulisiibacteriota bacterium]